MADDAGADQVDKHCQLNLFHSYLRPNSSELEWVTNMAQCGHASEISRIPSTEKELGKRIAQKFIRAFFKPDTSSFVKKVFVSEMYANCIPGGLRFFGRGMKCFWDAWSLVFPGCSKGVSALCRR